MNLPLIHNKRFFNKRTVPLVAALHPKNIKIAIPIHTKLSPIYAKHIIPWPSNMYRTLAAIPLIEHIISEPNAVQRDITTAHKDI